MRARRQRKRPDMKRGKSAHQNVIELPDRQSDEIAEDGDEITPLDKCTFYLDKAKAELRAVLGDERLEQMKKDDEAEMKEWARARKRPTPVQAKVIAFPCREKSGTAS